MDFESITLTTRSHCHAIRSLLLWHMNFTDAQQATLSKCSFACLPKNQATQQNDKREEAQFKTVKHRTCCDRPPALALPCLLSPASPSTERQIERMRRVDEEISVLWSAAACSLLLPPSLIHKRFDRWLFKFGPSGAMVGPINLACSFNLFRKHVARIAERKELQRWWSIPCVFHCFGFELSIPVRAMFSMVEFSFGLSL